MKVSIITINYNNIDGLKLTFKSVVHQTYLDREFIVIDGGSTDGAKDLLLSHSEEMTYWCSERDGGLYDAMNKGIRLSTGDYIVFMNSGDCFFNDNVLSDIFGMDEYSEDVLYGSTVYSYGTKGVVRHPRNLDVLNSELPWCHQSTFIRGDVMRERLYDTRFRIIADYDFFYKLWKDHKSFRRINKIVAIYDTTGMSADRTRSIEMYKEKCMIHGEKFSMYAYHQKQLRQKVRCLLRMIIPARIMDVVIRRPKNSTMKIEIENIIQM